MSVFVYWCRILPINSTTGLDYNKGARDREVGMRIGRRRGSKKKTTRPPSQWSKGPKQETGKPGDQGTRRTRALGDQ